jgi:golgi apparatus protein 1
VQRDKSDSVSAECKTELYRQEVENSDDIRLSLRLHKVCRGDQVRFCKDVEYGEDRVIQCLENHRKDMHFSTECRKEVESVMERRSRDYKLDPEIRTLCAEDIDRVCGAEEERSDSEVPDGKVLMCLVDFRDDIRSEECRDAVHRVMKLSSEDIRFSESLADSCFEDRQKYCDGLQPGSARVIRCLQKKRDDGEPLSQNCKSALFEQEVILAEDIDFQYPLRAACAEELTTICKHAKKGRGRLVRCLQEKVDDTQMGTECAAEVRKNMRHMATDYRLNYRLYKACNKDIEGLCSDVCEHNSITGPCAGRGLRCLQDKLDEITSPQCKEEVFYFIKMEVSDYKNDVLLAEACRKDVEKFCYHIKEPGQSKVLECLRDNRCGTRVSVPRHSQSLSCHHLSSLIVLANV